MKIMHKRYKYGENWQSGNPAVQIWQSWWSYTFLSASIEFLGPQNVEQEVFTTFLGMLVCV